MCTKLILSICFYKTPILFPSFSTPNSMTMPLTVTISTAYKCKKWFFVLLVFKIAALWEWEDPLSLSFSCLFVRWGPPLLLLPLQESVIDYFFLLKIVSEINMLRDLSFLFTLPFLLLLQLNSTQRQQQQPWTTLFGFFWFFNCKCNKLCLSSSGSGSLIH